MFSFITETAVGRLLTCGVHQPQYALSLFRAVLGYVCVKDPFLIHFLCRYQILPLFEDATQKAFCIHLLELLRIVS